MTQLATVVVNGQLRAIWKSFTTVVHEENWFVCFCGACVVSMFSFKLWFILTARNLKLIQVRTQLRTDFQE